MFVRSWMSSPVVTLLAAESVIAALRLMEVHRVRRLPVLSGGRLVGIVTREDVYACLGIGEGSIRNLQLPLETVMRSPVHTVVPDDTLEHASRLMLEKEVSGLPVMDGEEVVGMITESDVFCAFNRILGIDERGARVVLKIPGDGDLMEQIRKAGGSLAIRSLAAFQTESGSWEVVMRLRGRMPAVLH